MAIDESRKPVKVGVKEGGGPPPGYLWNVDLLDIAHQEAVDLLSPEQYDHVADQVRELAATDEPTQSPIIDVRPVENLHEIRDKGGVLGRLNIRLFFFLDKDTRTIVVLGVFHKQNNGATPTGDRLRMRRRRRLYLELYRPKRG